MGTNKERVRRLQELPNIINSYPEPGPTMRELLARLSLEWGVTEITLKDYVSILVTANKVRWVRDMSISWEPRTWLRAV